MELLYAEEHLTCFNYNVGEDSLMRVLQYKRDQTDEFYISRNSLLFVLEGALNFSYGKHVNKYISEGHMIMLPPRYKCIFNVESDTTLLIFSLDMEVSFCDHYSFEMLLQEKNNDSNKSLGNDVYPLAINEMVHYYIDGLMNYLRDGLRCSFFLELKIKEFLYVLRAYYPKDRLKAFFYPILNNDLAFSSLIYHNYRKTGSVKQLAGLLNYSISGFEKRFKKVFGMPANQWIQKQRAHNIYHEITCTNKTFTELGFEFGFSSPSHFNDFCKKVFNEPPGNIRKRNIRINGNL